MKTRNTRCSDGYCGASDCYRCYPIGPFSYCCNKCGEEMDEDNEESNDGICDSCIYSHDKDEIVQIIKVGVTRFGEYTLLDKGLSAVCDVNKILNILVDHDSETIGKILVGVLEDKSIDTVAHSAVASIVCNLDDLPEEAFEEILDYDERLKEMY